MKGNKCEPTERQNRRNHRRNQETPETATAELGERSIGLSGDVSNLADLDKLFAEVKSRLGRIDILFANAGIAHFAPIIQVDEPHFDQMFGINMRGLFLSVQKAFPLLSEGSSVIMTASVAAQTGNPGLRSNPRPKQRSAPSVEPSQRN